MKKKYLLRIDAELKNQLEMVAGNQKRSLNSLIELALEDYAKKLIREDMKSQSQIYKLF